jgi:hypothetical protein
MRGGDRSAMNAAVLMESCPDHETLSAFIDQQLIRSPGSKWSSISPSAVIAGTSSWQRTNTAKRTQRRAAKSYAAGSDRVGPFRSLRPLRS